MGGSGRPSFSPSWGLAVALAGLFTAMCDGPRRRCRFCRRARAGRASEPTWGRRSSTPACDVLGDWKERNCTRTHGSRDDWTIATACETERGRPGRTGLPCPTGPTRAPSMPSGTRIKCGDASRAHSERHLRSHWWRRRRRGTLATSPSGIVHGQPPTGIEVSPGQPRQAVTSRLLGAYRN